MNTLDHSTSTVDDCRIINLPCHRAGDGTLTVAENSVAIPFAIRRIYYIYDIPSSSERGGHSHHTEQRLLIAASGCFDVRVCDGRQWRTFTLKKPDQALYIPAGIWRVLNNFSSGSVVLALSSTRFDENDYVRDFKKFTLLKGCIEE